MKRRLKDNPLKMLEKVKSKEHLESSEEMKKCIFLKYYAINSKYFCTSPRSRLRGLLGNESDAIKNCSTCHVAKF